MALTPLVTKILQDELERLKIRNGQLTDQIQDQQGDLDDLRARRQDFRDRIAEIQAALAAP